MDSMPDATWPSDPEGLKPRGKAIELYLFCESGEQSQEMTAAGVPLLSISGARDDGLTVCCVLRARDDGLTVCFVLRAHDDGLTVCCVLWQKCFYCKKRMRKTSGCCVQCSHGRCPTSFHATCAQAAGVLMQPDDWPFVVYVTCWRHKGSVHTAVRRGEGGGVGVTVYPLHQENRDCVNLGPPSEGDVVQVRWTDGLIYGAKFVAAHIIPMYQVEFEDGSQLTAKRDDVYTLEEELPKRVKSRLSVASDMRFDGIFTEKEVKRDSKRQRVINSRYREDYIEPVIYRAIME
ncbi:hypothetical protein JZ751_009385 [Albula glossodonta]|uniref:PHD-type domain-containing protein n=1 Tax=Albula glossodonta TaxID=121402 RepID=A0A8T2N8A3_9TELE|nr:hypothetical protein JZ751_009385 [Albula glossodonta]